MDFHNFSCATSQENAKVIGVKISCHTFVMLLPYRVKISDTKVTHFTPILALCTCLYACVRVNGGHFEINFEPLTFCCVLFVSSILVSVNVIDINMCKVLILVWNVLLLCLRLSHGMVATKRMYGKKFLRQWLWHSLVKLCTKNYENQSIFVKVTAKKSVAPFFWTRCVCMYIIAPSS